MKKQELVSNMVRCLQEYYSPMVMVKDSISLSYLKMNSQLKGKIFEFPNSKIIDDLNKLPCIQEKDELCLGLTVRLFEKGKLYILIVGEPDKDEWYGKGIAFSKNDIDSFSQSKFILPDTS
jgi:hypothetical protein